MSSKFNKGQKTQKTPKVCKIPPIPFPPSTQEFEQYPLQAFASWKNPFSPLDTEISGYADLAADATSHIHFGTIKGDPHSLELDLIYDPVTKIFTYTVTLLEGPTVIDDRVITFADPAALLPYEAGMITWDKDGTTDTVRSKIYS